MTAAVAVPRLILGSRAEWREWLACNASTHPPVRLVVQTRAGAEPGVLVAEAMAEALCFGWIDSRAMPYEGNGFALTFSPRNPKSTWSRVNRGRVAALTAAGLMTPAGQAMVDLARRTGTWDALAEAENLVIPTDLQARFDQDAEAAQHFSTFPPSSRRLILEWIAKAKRPDTRARRIAGTVELAAVNRRANHPRPASPVASGG